MMSKPIAKKKKHDGQAEAEALVKQQIETRHKIAMTALEAQDDETRAVLWAIVDRLRLAANGTVRVYPNGKRGDSYAVPISQEYQDYNLLFVATEILKDLALLDVRVANYEMPLVYCAECGERISAPRKKKS